MIVTLFIYSFDRNLRTVRRVFKITAFCKSVCSWVYVECPVALMERFWFDACREGY